MPDLIRTFNLLYTQFERPEWFGETKEPNDGLGSDPRTISDLAEEDMLANGYEMVDLIPASQLPIAIQALDNVAGK